MRVLLVVWGLLTGFLLVKVITLYIDNVQLEVRYSMAWDAFKCCAKNLTPTGALGTKECWDEAARKYLKEEE